MRALVKAWLAAFVACAFSFAPSLAAQAVNPDDREPRKVFATPPRELTRLLARAREAIEAREYRAAVELLGHVLADASREDWLIPGEDPSQFRSIQLVASDLLGEVPAEFRSEYELRYSVTVRQMLEQSVAAGDYNLLARVAGHYFHTPAGQTATMLLAHHNLEKGQLVAAERQFSRIANDSAARQRHDPDVTVMLAVCQALSGSRDKAAQTLAQWPKRPGFPPVVFQGKVVPVFESPERAIEWLEGLIGEASLGQAGETRDWVMFRGGPARNGHQGTGAPLADPQWTLPVLNELSQERLAVEAFEARRATGKPLVPALQPLAIGNTVVVRTMNTTLGIDFTSGKRIWEFPPWVPGGRVPLEDDVIAERTRQANQWHVEQRIWEDHLYGQLSSNGRDVYLIDQAGFAGGLFGQVIGAGGDAMADPLGGRETNELKCVELARQGAFRWEVGGETGGNEPALRGGFFLGAPLPLDDSALYTICELDSEIRLVALDQKTGAMLWSRQLAVIDAVQPVVADPARRLAGASPSASEGILVCPISSGGLVAIDLATRSLLWGVTWPVTSRDKDSQDLISSHGIDTPPPQSFKTTSIDSSVTIVGREVLVAPVESDRIFCFDLVSGDRLWVGDDGQAGQPRDDGIYIGGVHNESVVVVGRTTVKGLDLKTGRTLWRQSLDALGEPTGRGFLAGGHYFVPCARSIIAEVAIESGEIVARHAVDRIPGNLICHEGAVIVQGHETIGAFHQVEALRERLANLPVANQRLASNRSLRARIQAHDGDMREAVVTAAEAWGTAPDYESERVVVGLLIEWLESDYLAAKPFAENYRELLEGSAPARFADARLRGAIDGGAIADVLDLLVHGEETSDAASAELANSQTLQTETTGPDPAVRMSSRQALKFRLREHLRDPMASETVRQYVKNASKELSSAQISSLANWLGPQWLDEPARMKLAESLISRDEWYRAEQVLETLRETRDDFAVQLATVRLLRAAGWQDRAVDAASQVAERFPDEIVKEVSGSFPARELDSRWFAGSSGPVTWDDWHYGAVHAQLAHADGRSTTIEVALIQPEWIASSGNVPDELEIRIDSRNSEIVLRDAMGHDLGRVAIQDAPDDQRYFPSRMNGGRYALQGHLLIVAWEYNLIAVDLHRLRRGDEGLLWRRRLHRETGLRDTLLLQSGMSARAIDNSWGRDQMQLLGRDGNAVDLFTSNANAAFFVIDETLNCVDLLTGETLWQRSGVPRGAWLAADEQSLFLLTPSGSSGMEYQSVDVLDSEFGGMKATVSLADFSGQSLWHSTGRIGVFTEQTGEQKSLVGVNLTDGRRTWDYQCEEDCLGCIRDPQTMIIQRGGGGLEYLDLRTGEIIRKVDMDLVSGKVLDVRRMHEHDLILVDLEAIPGMVPRSRQLDRSVRASSTAGPLFDGNLVCVDLRKNRPRWPTPVRVEHLSLPSVQPAAVPLMTFSRTLSSIRNEPNRSLTPEFYTIDLRDGRLVNVTRREELTQGPCEMTGWPESQKAELWLGGQRLIFEFTDQALPDGAATPARLVNEATMAEPGGDLDPPGSVEDLRRRQAELLREMIEKGPAKTDDRPQARSTQTATGDFA